MLCRLTRAWRGAVLLALATPLIAGCGSSGDGAGHASDRAARKARKEATWRREDRPTRISDGPNVIVVMTDDQDRGSVRFMKQVSSRVVDDGTLFDQFVTNFPLCCPSRSTFLTGQYAHNHGVVSNSRPDGGFPALDSNHTLPIWLHRVGYRTIHVGKYLNLYGKPDPTLVPRGWDRWFTAVGDSQDVYDYDLNENGTIVHYGTKVSDFKQDVLSDLAVGEINAAAGGRKPIYMAVDYTAPHSAGPNPSPQPGGNCPGDPKAAPRYADTFSGLKLPHPPGFNEADVSDKPPQVREQLIDPVTLHRMKLRYRCRIQSLQAVDDGVGKMLDALKAKGELNNTVFVYTSDNGLFGGEHRLNGGKGRPYEPSIGVPLAIRGPGVKRGRTLDDLVVNADMAPTILDYAGGRADIPVDGRSFRPLLTGDSLPGRSIALEAKAYSETPTYNGVRSSRYVYVRYADGARELYDLKVDPAELHNEIDNPAYDGVERELGRLLDRLKDCAGAACRNVPDLTRDP